MCRLYESIFSASRALSMISLYPIHRSVPLLLTPVRQIDDEKYRNGSRKKVRVPAPMSWPIAVQLSASRVQSDSNYASGDMMAVSFIRAAKNLLSVRIHPPLRPTVTMIWRSAPWTENKTPGFSCATPEMGLPIPSVRKSRELNMAIDGHSSDRLLKLK